MKNILLLVFTALSLVGCATSRTNEAQRIVETQFNLVKECKTLGEIAAQTNPLLAGMIFMDSTKSWAKNEALNLAATMGATHVVWTLSESTWGGGRAAGIAYKCVKVAGN